jgi:hypothetical protein
MLLPFGSPADPVAAGRLTVEDCVIARMWAADVVSHGLRWSLRRINETLDIGLVWRIGGRVPEFHVWRESRVRVRDLTVSAPPANLATMADALALASSLMGSPGATQAAWAAGRRVLDGAPWHVGQFGV